MTNLINKTIPEFKAQAYHNEEFKRVKKLDSIEIAKKPARFDIINFVLSSLKRETTYLEIGVRNPADGGARLGDAAPGRGQAAVRPVGKTRPVRTGATAGRVGPCRRRRCLCRAQVEASYCCHQSHAQPKFPAKQPFRGSHSATRYQSRYDREL